jgi:hypothetical protein
MMNFPYSRLQTKIFWAEYLQGLVEFDLSIRTAAGSHAVAMMVSLHVYDAV